MAKTIQVSDDSGTTWYTLPGGQGEIDRSASQLDDTIFGETFKSQDRATAMWQIVAQAYYKGQPGYKTTIKEAITSTGATGEAMEVVGAVSGKRWRITNTSKEIWDRASPIWLTHGDTTIPLASIVSFNHLFGEVVFTESFTAILTLLINVNYLTLADLGKPQSHSLQQTVDAIQTTDYPTVNSNGGWHTHDPGLRTVTMDMDGVYHISNTLAAHFEDGDQVIIEVNPDGAGKSRMRGFFKVLGNKNSGNVGALEQESVQFALNVPDPSGDASEPEFPLYWDHAEDTTLSTAVQKVLTAFQNETKLSVRYLHDGTAGWSGTAVVTDVSLSGGLEAMNEFSVTFQGDGALSDV